MIDKQYDKFLLICDICVDPASCTFFEFDEAVNYKREFGWKSQKLNGHWYDICPDCQDDDVDITGVI